MSWLDKLGEQLTGALGDVQEKAKKAVEKEAYRVQSGIGEPKTDTEKAARGIGTAFGGIKKALAPIGEAFAPAISAVKQGNAKRREEDLRLQTEEEAKREERKKAGTFDGTASFGILSKWFEDDLNASEKNLKQKEKEQKETLEYIKELEGPTRLANQLVSITMQEYKRTGTEEARQRYERARKSANEHNQKYSAALGLYGISYGEYEGAVNSYNKTVQEANSYYERERAALEENQGRARTDIDQIDKELKEAEAALTVYEEQIKQPREMRERWTDSSGWENEGMTYEDWLNHVEWIAQHPERINWEEEKDVQARWWAMYDSILPSLTEQQKKVDGLKKEKDLVFEKQPGFAIFSEPRPHDEVDSAYDFINGIDEVTEALLDKNTTEARRKYFDAVLLFDRMGWEPEILDAIRNKEIKRFNYIYATKGKEKAYEYIDSIYKDLGARRYEEEKEVWEEYAEEHEFLANNKSFLLKLDPRPMLGNAINYIRRGEIDEYATYNDSVNEANAIRSKTKEGMGDFGATVYDIGMSMGDVVTSILVSRGLGKLAGAVTGGGAATARAVTPKLSQTLMANRVFGDSTVEAKKRGFTDGEAFAFGLVSATVEALTERMPIDAFLDGKTLKQSGWRYIRNSALSEMGEEAASNVLNTISEILIAKDKSEWRRSIEYYKEQGYDGPEAINKAIGDEALSFGIDAIGGLLSGGLLATGPVAVNKTVDSYIKRAEVADAMLGQIEAQDIAREKAAQRAQITPVTAQNAAEGYVLPTAKDTMAVRKNRTNTNATAMDTMTDEEHDAQMDVLDAEASMAGQSMLYDDGRQFVIKKTEGNQNFVEVEGDILQGVPKKQWIQTVKDTLKKKFPQGVTIRNDTIKINAKTRGEITNSEYTRWIADHSAQKYADKLRATNNADEIIEAASNWTGEAPLHDRTDNIVEFARGDVLMRIGKNGYSADVVVVTTKEGSMLLYDIVNMEPTVIKEKSQTQTAATPLAGISDRTSAFSSNDNISQTSAFSQENSARNPFGGNMLPTAEELNRQRRAANAETETERTGILLGVSEKKIRTATRLSKIIGKEIVFYRNTDGSVTGDLGYYNHNDGKIYLNADAENPVAVVLGHEMIHDIQLTDGYIKFFVTVFRKMQADGINLSEARAELKARYARHGVDLNTTAKIDQDLVAEYAQAHLFTDEASITSIVNADKESGRKIANFLDGILAKLGNTDAQERVFVQKARALYAKALRENAGAQNAKQWKNDVNVARNEANTKTSLDTMTDEEYDARMDVLDAESSMAGESMLYEDGRQFMIGDEKEVAENKRAWYNESNEKIGGKEYGRKVADDRNRRVSAKHSGEQVGASVQTGGRNQTKPYTEGGKQRRGRRTLRDTDSEGRAISYKNREKIRETTVVNQNGEPIVTKHFTPEMNFVTFEKGDIGFHFGTEEQAYNRAVAKKATRGRVFNAYLNFKNPLHTNRDFMNWHANATALNLWKDDILSTAEKDEITMLSKQGVEYDSPASVRLREILTKKGYDSIAYPNGHEGEGLSYVAFEDEQIIKTAIEEVEVAYDGSGKLKNVIQKSVKTIDSEDEAGRQYAITKDDADMADTETKAPGTETLPKRAANVLRQAERRLLESIGETLGVPKRAQTEFLQRAVREISEDYLETGKISREKADTLFDTAYEQGIVVNAEYYEQYKHIRDHLRNTKVSISPEDSSSIADFNDFRKRAFGKLRIVNEGGLPVDAAYTELMDMAPELFPEDITHPADQLQKMYEVADGIRKVEQTLDEAYGDDAEIFREAARDEFHATVNSAAIDLQRVRRFAEDKARIAEEETTVEAEEVQTREQLDEAYKNLKEARRALQKARAQALLTEEDEMRVGELLRGEITPMSLDPEKDNVKDILAVYKAKKEYEKHAGRIKTYNQKRKEALRAKARESLGKIKSWKDKNFLGGLRYSMETMERVFRDVMGEDAPAMVREYLTPVHKATAAATKLKNKMRKRVKGLNLSRKVAKGNAVSEAHAVQLLGEAEDNIAVLKAMRKKDATRDGKKLAEWENIVQKLWTENPNLDEGKIRNAVAAFREIYDSLFEQMNDARVRNGYEPVNYRRGYFPHFQPGDEGVLAQFGRALGIDTAVSALPTTINGLTHTFRPGIQWFGNAMERIGFSTVYDAVEGFDKYIEGVADVIYQTDNIQKLRALAREIRYAASEDGVRKQVDLVEKDSTLTREQKDLQIQDIFEKAKISLSNFVVELDEYTNLLANKKSRADREMERNLGRGFYNIARRVNSNVAAAMTALNIPSWLTNFIPLTQAWGLTDTRHLLRGMRATIKAYFKEDGIVSQSTFLTNRRGADPLVKAWQQGEEAKNIFGKAWRGYQAGVDKLSGGMEFIDRFTSDSIVRAKYYQNIDAGMSEEAAMDDADAFAAGVMADRSKGGTPTIFGQTNPLKKLFTQFQIEVNNQYRYLFKDLPAAMQERGLAALTVALFKVFLGAFVYNELYELLFGRRAAFDPAGIIKDITEEIQKEGNNAWDVTVNVGKEVLEEAPFIGGVLGGGRVPISSALPDAINLGRALLDGSWDGKKRVSTLAKEAAKPLYYMVLPGGGQVKKAVEGVIATVKGGSYTLDADGNETLQYPVYNDTPGQAIGNGIRAVLFGKSTLPTAKDWVDSGFKSLSAEDTKVYKALLAVGVPGKDALAAVHAVRDAAKGNNKRGAEKSNDKRDAIRTSNLSEEAKKILYRSRVSDTRDEEIAALESVGIAFDDFLQIQNEYANIDDTDAKAGAKALAFSRWLNTTTYSGEQKAAIKEAFQYWTGAPATASGYDKFVNAGLTDEKAVRLVTTIDSLEPEKGKTKVSNIQRYKAVVTQGLPEKDQMAVLSTMMGESEYAKLEVGRTHGVTPVMYVTFKEKVGAFDEDGNGTLKQEEVTKALRNMSGGMNLPRHDGTSFNLTNKQKAVLWQLANKSWKPKNNPFDTSVGLQVYSVLNRETE